LLYGLSMLFWVQEHHLIVHYLSENLRCHIKHAEMPCPQVEGHLRLQSCPVWLSCTAANLQLGLVAHVIVAKTQAENFDVCFCLSHDSSTLLADNQSASSLLLQQCSSTC